MTAVPDETSRRALISEDNDATYPVVASLTRAGLARGVDHRIGGSLDTIALRSAAADSLRPLRRQLVRLMEPVADRWSIAFGSPGAAVIAMVPARGHAVDRVTRAYRLASGQAHERGPA
jgi:hypothetical protein